MTTLTGGTSKVSADGALVWHKPYGAIVATDDAGDVIVGGSFTGTLVVDDTTLVAAGGSDVFVARLDTEGNLVRAVALGGAADETLTGLAVDHAGHVVVSGPGLGTVALDANDAPAWSVAFYGHIATDYADDVLVTGSLAGSMDFGGGVLSSAGGSDVFVAKLDSAGSHLFSARYGDTGSQQEGQAISADSEGNLLVAGVFDGSVDFGTGALGLTKCPSEAWCKQSGFIAKLDPTGTAVWSVTRGPMRALSGVIATSAGNVLVTGASPADASPYHMPVIFALDATTGKKLWQRSELPETGLGVGRAFAVDSCDSVLWSVAVKPTLAEPERAYLAKLSP